MDECNCEYSKYYGAVKPQGSEGFLDDNDNKGEGGFFCDDAYKIYSRNYGNLTEGLICWKKGRVNVGLCVWKLHILKEISYE